MPQIVAAADLVVDHDTHTIILTRSLAAPCDQVFAAWTQPEQLALWWDPAGEPLAECEIDLRPGGAFKYVNRRGDHPFSGVYRAIEPPRRLVFDTMGAVGRVDFDEADGRTRLTVRIECGSAGNLELYLQRGIHTGTSRTLDNLVAFVGADN